MQHNIKSISGQDFVLKVKMSGQKYRSDRSGKSEKYTSSYRDHEGGSKSSYSAAYDDHYSSHCQPPKVNTVKVARKQHHRSPDYDPVYDLKKSHKNKADYRQEFKDPTSKKLKSKDEYYSYRDQRDVYKDDYYEDSNKAMQNAASTSKKYYADDGFKESARLYQSDRAHKELPAKDSYKGKDDLYYEESYKPRKTYAPYDVPPTKSYKEYSRDKKYSVSPPRKITRRSYSFSPPQNKQPAVYDHYRETQYEKPQDGDLRGRGRPMNKPRGDYQNTSHPTKPMGGDLRDGGHVHRPRIQDFRDGALLTKGRGLSGSNGNRYDPYTGLMPPVVEQRGRAYDNFSNSYQDQRDSYFRPEPLHPKEKKYSQYNDIDRPPKSVEPPAQLSRYVIGDSVVYGSPGHYPQGLVSPRRYSLSPPRRPKYPPKEVSLSPPPGLDGPGSFRQQTPSLSPHYPRYDEPRRRASPAREKRKLSLSPARPVSKRIEGGPNKRPPSPPPRNSFSPSFKRTRNAGAPPSGIVSKGSASDRHWSGSKRSSGPSQSARVKQLPSDMMGRRNASPPANKELLSKDGSTSEKGSAKSRSSSRRSRSPSDHGNKNQRSKHEVDDRSSPSSKKPLLNNPSTSPANSQQGLLGAKPPLLCTPPLLSLPAPPLMGVRPAMPMLPPMLGRPGGLLDGRLGLVGGSFKRLPGDTLRGGRLGGRGRGNMRRPMDLRGLIESRKERHQPQMGRFAPPGHRRGEGPMPDARHHPADAEGRRGWHQDHRVPHPRPGERFPRCDGRPQQVVPRVRDRLVSRPGGVRPPVARKPLVSRVPRITSRKLVPSTRPGGANVQGLGAVRLRANPSGGGVVRSNRSPTGARAGVRGGVIARPKLSALVTNRNALLKKYQRLTGRNRPNEGTSAGARRALPNGRGAAMLTVRKKSTQQQLQDRDDQRRVDDKTHRKQETSDHRRDDNASWRRESGGGGGGTSSRRDDSRSGREARDRREGSAGRARRGNSPGRDGKKKNTVSSPRKLEKPQRGARGALDCSPKVSSTTGGSNSSNNKNKRRLSRSPSSSSSADSYKRHRAKSAPRRDSSGSRNSKSPRHNKFSRSSPPYAAKNSSASSHRRSKYSPSLKLSSKYNSKSSRPVMRRSRSRSRSSSGSMSSISRGRKSVSPSLSP
ncbi:hypothetical protein FHG87_006364 [Trinorchestia longiramus]|nr:hypothetical protein FHG87_006364 [Trinorchestia longiramus]